MSVKILPRAGDAWHIRLAAELAFGADFARDAGHFRSETVQLIDHRIDGVLELENFALHVDGDLSRKVAAGDGGGDFGDVAHLAVRFDAIEFTLSVRSFQVPATPGTTAWPPSLPSVPTSRATRVTSEANDRSWSTIVLMASFSCRISPLTSTVIFFERSPLATAIVTSAMLRTCAVRFDAIELTLSVRSFQTPRDFADLRLTAELSFGADFAGDAGHFGGEHAELLDHRVDDRRRTEKLALQGATVNVEAHGLQQVALRHGFNRASDFERRPQQVINQGVDRVFHLGPGAIGQAETDAIADAALASDDLANVFKLTRHPLISGNDIIEAVSDLAHQRRPVVR